MNYIGLHRLKCEIGLHGYKDCILSTGRDEDGLWGHILGMECRYCGKIVEVLYSNNYHERRKNVFRGMGFRYE